MGQRGEEPLLPPNAATYLTDWLFDIGPSVAGAMGETEIGYADLVAWQRIHGVVPTPWEAQTLRRLSRDYVSERQRARKREAEAPFTGGEDKEKIAERLARQGKSIFAAVRAHLAAKSKAQTLKPVEKRGRKA